MGIKDTMNSYSKKLKRAVFLALVAYIYDKIVNRKKKKKEYIEDVDYEVKNKKE